jgi:predicted N-formylglutamate amidohydrolase
MPYGGDLSVPAVSVENREGGGVFLFVCEHAANVFPDEFGTLGLDEGARRAHIAWDPGALGLARALARRTDSTLVHAGVSRLIYDCNRPPQAEGAMPARSEVYDIPGNQRVSPQDRLRRTEAVYLPFHNRLHAEIARRLALGRPTVMVTVHSFTPVWYGKPRAVEFGVIHDADPGLAQAVTAAARATGWTAAALNEPYSAADGVTHTLRLHATPYGLPNVMLEIRNDLIATPEAEATMAARLAPILETALATVSADGRGAA